MAAAKRQFFVHAGLPKSGSSYLQDVLFASREAVRAQGMALIPPRRRDHFRLMLQVRGLLRDFDRPAAFHAEERYRDAVASNTAPSALLTEESLSAASPQAISAVLEPLGDLDVHLVVAARDLGRQLPSAWQQKVKGRRTQSFGEFLGIVEEGAGPVANEFWSGQELPKVLERWATRIPPDRIHVITVPSPGADSRLLLDRFCAVLGLDPATLRTDAPTINASLGHPQAELLRRVNVALGQRLPHSRAGYRRVARSWLSDQVLFPQAGPRARVPISMRPWIERTTEDWIQQVRAAGYHVVGDLDELRTPVAAYDDELTEPSSAELLDAAVAALAEILVRRDVEMDARGADRRRIEGLERQLRELQRAQGWWRPSRVAGAVRGRMRRRARGRV